jgi:pyridoxamine 5'-phosphate oxidase
MNDDLQLQHCELLNLMIAQTLSLLFIFQIPTVFSYTMSSWESSLRDIIVKNKRVVESKYITFTTITEHGWPAARTVVFRGFHEQDNKVYLKFISDNRSQKIADLEKSDKVELCWYLTKNKDQFRIRGHGKTISSTSLDAKGSKLRVQLWNGLSDGARAPFFFPGDPGEEVEEVARSQLATNSITDSAGDYVANTKVADSVPAMNALKLESSESELEPSESQPRKKFVPIIPDPETVRALRAERKTGEEEASKDTRPPPDCFSLILVDPITGIS